RRSMPTSLARRRTAGEASGFSPSGRGTPVDCRKAVSPPLAPPRKGEGDSVAAGRLAVDATSDDTTGGLSDEVAAGSAEWAACPPPPCGEGLGVGVALAGTSDKPAPIFPSPATFSRTMGEPT